MEGLRTELSITRLTDIVALIAALCADQGLFREIAISPKVFGRHLLHRDPGEREC